MHSHGEKKKNSMTNKKVGAGKWAEKGGREQREETERGRR